MTIVLTKDVRVGGSVLSSGSTQTLAADVEADLVARGCAAPTGRFPGVSPVGANHSSEHATLSDLVKIIPFQNFVPRILPSYAASTTADQSGTTVTVNATAHGIPNIAVLTGGHEVYFPGCASIAAGWYPGFSRASANTITFTYPVSQTVSGESVNSGAAYTAATKFYDLVIPGGMMGVNGECTGRLMRHCGSTAATKLTSYNLAGSAIMKSPLATTLGCGYLDNTFANVGSVSKQMGFSSPDQIGVANGGQMYGAVNMAVDQILELFGTVSAGLDYLAISSAYAIIKP